MSRSTTRYNRRRPIIVPFKTNGLQLLSSAINVDNNNNNIISTLTTTSSSSIIESQPLSKTQNRLYLASLAKAKNVMNKNKTDKTKAGYQSKIKKMTDWYRIYRPNCVDQITGKLRLPLTTNDVLAFFGSLLYNKDRDSVIISDSDTSDDEHEEKEEEVLDEKMIDLVTTTTSSTNNLNLRKVKPYSTSTIQSYKSALCDYYLQNHTILDAETRNELSILLAGYKRDYATMKNNGEVDIFEGKHPLTFKGYTILCKRLMQLEPERHEKHSNVVSNSFNVSLFAWPFFTLQWNMIARSINVADLMLQHLSWRDDSLIITSPKTKTDQEGVNCFPRHVYANPTNFVICPILSLAVLTFCKSFRYNYQEVKTLESNTDSQSEPVKLENYFQLFEGDSQEQRFSKILQRVLSKLSENDLHVLGANKDQIGTHIQT